MNDMEKYIHGMPLGELAAELHSVSLIAQLSPYVDALILETAERLERMADNLEEDMG